MYDPKGSFERRPAARLGSLSVLLLSGSAACSLAEVDSADVRTETLYVDMLAIAPGDGSTLVRVALTVSGASGTNVRLVGDDEFVAEAGDVSASLARRGEGRYEGTLQKDSAGAISVRLERGAEHTSGAAISLLPEPFAMQLENTDYAGAGISRSEPIFIGWTGGGAASLEWSIDGSCIWPESGITPDDGFLALLPERLRVRPGRAQDACEVLLTLDRSNTAAVEPPFVPGSRFRAVQRRGISFLSTPAQEGASDAVPFDGGL